MTARSETMEEIEAVFRLLYPSLVRSLSLLLGEHAAADVAQDAFIQAFRHWDRVRELDHPEAWIRRAAANRALNEVRRRRRLSAFLARRTQESVLPPTPADLDLREAVAELPDAQRLAVGLYYYSDLQVRDVAALLHISEGTVKSALADGRSALARNRRLTND